MIPLRREDAQAVLASYDRLRHQIFGLLGSPASAESRRYMDLLAFGFLNEVARILRMQDVRQHLKIEIEFRGGDLHVDLYPKSLFGQDLLESVVLAEDEKTLMDLEDPNDPS